MSRRTGFRVDTTAAERRLDGLERRLADRRGIERIAARLAELARERTARSFEREQSPSGKAWAPRARAYPWRPLQRTGTLRSLIDFRTTTGRAGGTIRGVVRDARERQTGTPYARIAGAVFYGVKRGPRRMAGRQAVGLSGVDKRKAKRFIQDLAGRGE